MSKVYSFRLSEENPREAQARNVIAARMNEGYSLRNIIVEVLLEYRLEKSDSSEYAYLLKQLQNIIEDTTRFDTETKSESSLSKTFKIGVVRSMKKGIQA